jgi:hypothetical protein
VTDGTILAVAGTLSAAIGTAGQFRIAAATMLAGNIIVIVKAIVQWLRRKPCE